MNSEMGSHYSPLSGGDPISSSSQFVNSRLWSQNGFSPVLAPLDWTAREEFSNLPQWSLPHRCCVRLHDHQPAYTLDWLLQ